jgi:elongation factor P
MKINASALRQGNVIEIDSKLYVILVAENNQPGKGVPVTRIEMRGVENGIKVGTRFRTTEQVELCYIEDAEYQYLYKDSEAFVFMNQVTFDQVTVPNTVVGEQEIYLQDSMVVTVKLYEGKVIAVILPAKVVLEVLETEPVIKGQTATSSYKPAILSNNVRTGVPGHIAVGTMIVVDTATGSYVERAK